jgi:hypothetical protein
VKKKFNFTHEEKMPLKTAIALHERVLMISEREIYVGVGVERVE